MQDICREAGISPGTLYLYFSSKEHLIAAICLRERTKFAQAVTALADAPDFMAAFGQLAQVYCHEQPHSKLRFQIEVNAEALRNPLIGDTIRECDAFIIEHFTKVIEQSSGKGLINPCADPVMLAQILSIIGNGLYMRRAFDPDFNVEQCMDAILLLLSPALQPAENDEADAVLSNRGEHETVN